MSKTEATFTNVSSGGCVLLEHQREMVAEFIFSASANHFPVLFRSTKATFNLLVRCSICQTIDYFCKNSDNSLNVQKILLLLR
jgi:hypothetical protein